MHYSGCNSASTNKTCLSVESRWSTARYCARQVTRCSSGALITVSAGRSDAAWSHVAAAGS